MSEDLKSIYNHLDKLLKNIDFEHTNLKQIRSNVQEALPSVEVSSYKKEIADYIIEKINDQKQQVEKTAEDEEEDQNHEVENQNDDKEDQNDEEIAKKQKIEMRDHELALKLQEAENVPRTRRSSQRVVLKHKTVKKMPKRNKYVIPIEPFDSILGNSKILKEDVLENFHSYLRDNNLIKNQLVVSNDFLFQHFGKKTFPLTQVASLLDPYIPSTRRNTGFNKPLVLSNELADLLNVKGLLARSQVSKKLWEYIKANDLQNPRDKREIVCDDKLKSVFKTDKVTMFSMNKILAKHLFKSEDLCSYSKDEDNDDEEEEIDDDEDK